MDLIRRCEKVAKDLIDDFQVFRGCLFQSRCPAHRVILQQVLLMGNVMSIKCVMAGIRVSHRFRICAEKSACKVDAVTFFHMQLVLDQVRRSTDQTLAAGRQCCNTMRIPWRVPQNWPPSRRSCVKSGWTGRCRCPRARTALRPASGTSCAARACVSSASARCCFKRGSRSTARC